MRALKESTDFWKNATRRDVNIPHWLEQPFSFVVYFRFPKLLSKYHIIHISLYTSFSDRYVMVFYLEYLGHEPFNA